MWERTGLRMSAISVLAYTSLLALLLALSSIPAAAAGGPFDELSECREDAQHNNSDAIYRICTPPDWWVNNGELIIWAHGYVDEFQPVEIPEGQLCFTETLCVNTIANALGYGFATTSYAVNGLAVLPGIQDVIELVDLYAAEVGEPPTRTYLVGASEGGLITTLALEQYPEIFDGGLALCGPIGDFPAQTNYFGDFRTVVDFSFPNLIPGDPTDIPPALIEIWDEFYETNVVPVLSDRDNRGRMRATIVAAGAQVDENDPIRTAKVATDDLLWYSVFATNNGVDVLGGQPYDNSQRVYEGTPFDDEINAGIERFAADPAAVIEMERYQTTGVLTNPLVTLHTLIDQQVPEWHEGLYLEKTKASGAWPELHINRPPSGVSGHCLFPIRDILDATCEMIFAVSGQECNFDVVQGLIDLGGGPDQLVRAHKLR